MQDALEDPSASVRIAAARALCRMERPAEAISLLERELRDGSQWVRLSAAIVLDESDGQARPALGTMRDALTPRDHFLWNGKYTVRVMNRALNELLGSDHSVP
jgi:uncharacterized sulfatase